MRRNNTNTRLKEEISKFREQLVELSVKSQESFDKAILTLSAGGLGFTFSFLDKIVPFGTSDWKGCLMLVWLFWAASMTCTLISFAFSNKALTREIAKLDREMEEIIGQDEVVGQKSFDDLLGDFCARRVGMLNRASLLMFLSGIVFLILFLWHNIEHARTT